MKTVSAELGIICFANAPDLAKRRPNELFKYSQYDRLVARVGSRIAQASPSNEEARLAGAMNPPSIVAVFNADEYAGQEGMTVMWSPGGRHLLAAP